MNVPMLSFVDDEHRIRSNGVESSSSWKEAIGTEDLKRILSDSYKNSKETLGFLESMIFQINDAGFMCIGMMDAGFIMIMREQDKFRESFLRLYIDKYGKVRIAKVFGETIISICPLACKNPNETIKAIVHIIESEIGDE